LVTDVSGQNISTIFKRQAAQEIVLTCLTLEDGTDILSRNVVSQVPPTQLLIQEKEGLKYSSADGWNLALLSQRSQ